LDVNALTNANLNDTIDDNKDSGDDENIFNVAEIPTATSVKKRKMKPLQNTFSFSPVNHQLTKIQ